MNIFSKERYHSLFVSYKNMLFVLLAFVLCFTGAQAQFGNDYFRGTWQIETPNNGALILIVKRGGLASYFWGDNTDRSVYQGTWSSTEDVATLTWSDGSKHEIKRDALGFGISYYSSLGNKAYTVPAQQVPKEILGQWAKPATRKETNVTARNQASGYFGIWQIGESNEFLFIESDRSAALSQAGEPGLRGSWAKQGSELHIVWDNGDYTILRENRRSFAYKRVTSGEIIEEDQAVFVQAERTVAGKVSASWLTNYKAERELRNAGIVFSSRKNARAFYRGTWLVKVRETAYERIEIGRFGGLSTSTDRKLEGSWRMDGQDIFMRWDNGQRRILSPVGDGFVLYEYKPGRPLDGVPTRTLPAAPADASKMKSFFQGRADVANQILALAEAAGISPEQQDAGWGRTFARWAWPFAQSGVASTDTLLVEAYEDTDANPWWWPFWSESAQAVTFEADDSKEKSKASFENSIVEERRHPDAVKTETEASKRNIGTEEIPEAVDEKSDYGSSTKNKVGTQKDWVWPFQ